MKKILLALGLLAAVAGSAWAQVTDPVYVNGHWKNSTTQWWTDANGNPYFTDASRDRDAYLTPQAIYADTTASTANGDSVSLGNLAGYRQVYLIFQTGFERNPGGWNKYAVNVRYLLGGATDSLSLVTMPVQFVSQAADSQVTAAAAAIGYATGTSATAAGRGECVLTLTTTGSAGLAGTKSLPQSQMFLMQIGNGNAMWPAGTVQLRIRRIAQAIANSTTTAGNPRPPVLRIWVLGTPL